MSRPSITITIRVSTSLSILPCTRPLPRMIGPRPVKKQFDRGRAEGIHSKQLSGRESRCSSKRNNNKGDRYAEAEYASLGECLGHSDFVVVCSSGGANRGHGLVPCH